MESPEHEVAGLCCLEAGFDGLLVPQLPDDYHVRILAERRCQASSKVGSVIADLSLADDGVFIPGKNILDRIFDGDGMNRAALGDHVQDGGDRGRFAGVGGPGHENQAPVDLLECIDRIHREPEFLGFVEFRWYKTDRDRERVALQEDVHPDPAEVGEVEGKVGLPLVPEDADLLLVEDLENDLLEFLGRNGGKVDPLDPAPDAKHRREGGFQVDIVGSHVESLFHEVLQELVHMMPFRVNIEYNASGSGL